MTNSARMMCALSVAAAGALAGVAWAEPGVRSEGGPYVLEWYTIDGGGGTSSGGAYTLSGSIGQHDASGPLAGGAYTLEPGFWAGVGGGSCPGDCDGNGLINLDDIGCFVDGFLDQTPEGDCDGNGLWSLDDIECFVQGFLAGCP